MANEIPNSFEIFPNIGTPLDPLTEQRYNVTGLKPPFEYEAAPPSQQLEISPFERYLMALESLQPPVEFNAGSYQEPSAPTFTPMAAPPAVRVTPPNVTESVSPFEKYLIDLENLQVPVNFEAGSYQGPSVPDFTPIATPTAVRVSPPTQFGPVTASEYAQPIVDPMSYYSDPDLSNPQALNQEQLNPVAEQLGTSATTIMDPNTGLPIEVVANPDFVEPRVLPNPPRIGLPDIPPGMLDPVMDYDQWKYVDRYIRKPDKPATPKEEENVKQLTPEEVEQMLGGQTPIPPVPPQVDVPRLSPEAPSTPGLPPIVTPKPVVSFPKPNLNLTELPNTTTPVRNPGRVIPFKMPTEVPIPPRRAAELLAPGYSQDINYDPDEILAAAMRVIRGRSAGKSLMY